MNGIKILLLLLSPFIYLGFAILVSFIVVRIVRRKVGKDKRWRPVQAGAITFIVILLIPTWNILIARGYMYYRCLIDGGLHVNQTVEIPEMYFDSYGIPRSRSIAGKNADIIIECFGEECFRRIRKHEVVFNLPPGSKIWRIETIYKNADTGKVMGNYVSYSHSTWYSMEKSPSVCPKLTKNQSLILNVFRPE